MSKEKLIELLEAAHEDYYEHFDTDKSCFEAVADRLLANGVTFAKDIDVPSKAKPLLCEYLGVDVNERFRIEDRSFVYYINDKGVVMVQSIAGLDDHESRDALYAVIYNPERVQRMSKQRLDDIIRQIDSNMQQSGKPMTEADKQQIRDNARTPGQVEAAIRGLESKRGHDER